MNTSPERSRFNQARTYSSMQEAFGPYTDHRLEPMEEEGEGRPKLWLWLLVYGAALLLVALAVGDLL